MAWDKNCETRYANRREIFEGFKARHKIKSCWDIGCEGSLNHLKGVLKTGMDIRGGNFYSVRNGRLECDAYLGVDISDHGAYFKTADNRVIYASQPYGELGEVTARVKDWETEHGLRAEVFGPDHSWYHEQSNLVLIFRCGDTPPYRG
jgi:hypothetical protein